jgi:hypothetical protein
VGGVVTGDGTDDGGSIPVVLGVVGRIDIPVHRVARLRADELDVTLDPARPDAATAAGERPAEPRVVRAVIAWVQSRGGEKVELHAGQTVYCPPGEEHWHGAAPDSFMEHLAMLDNADDPAATTTWLEHVTDDDYLEAPATPRTPPSPR